MAKARKGGPMRDRRAGRGGARNEQAELLEELGSDPPDVDVRETGETVKRFKLQAEFFVQADDAEDALRVGQDMLNDMVSEQYEHVDGVRVLGEVEQDEYHAAQEEEDSE